jgi:hypothetical protein
LGGITISGYCPHGQEHGQFFCIRRNSGVQLSGRSLGSGDTDKTSQN